MQGKGTHKQAAVMVPIPRCSFSKLLQLAGCILENESVVSCLQSPALFELTLGTSASSAMCTIVWDEHNALRIA